MSKTAVAKFGIGQVVRHRVLPVRGVVFDVDAEFASNETWYESIPADVRPRKDQPFYVLFAENKETQYVAYVSEQSLIADFSTEPVSHPQIDDLFDRDEAGIYHRCNTRFN